ncbi:hypothetical protein [Nocardia sp. NBC_00511]|uniref:DUF7373 family lipoprotein n=1 Tax=Nocardia sp. NBC_00511 TaxID=2903591 RepID=UPI0030E438B2
MLHSFTGLRAARSKPGAGIVIACAVVVLATAGCGFGSHPAERVSVDLTALDTGSFPTAPTPVTATDAAAAGRNAEAIRLGNAMPLPMEVDPALTVNAGGVHPFADISDVLVKEMNGGRSAFGWLDSAAFTTNPAGFTAGFATSARTNEDSTLGYQLTDVVMTFDSDADAAAAATAFGAGGFLDVGMGKDEPARSTAHPSASITWEPWSQTLAAFYPTGKYVILTLVDNHEKFYEKLSDLPDLITKSDKAIDVTADRLKSFQPTPPDQLSALPLDPQGMLRLTLPRPPGDQTAHAFAGTLAAHGALQNAGEPAVDGPMFDQDGIDAVSYGAGALFRARDADSAQRFLGDYSVGKFNHLLDSPAGLPIAKCRKYYGPNARAFPFDCMVAHGRYVAEVWSQQQQDVLQRISAQYAILANDK